MILLVTAVIALTHKKKFGPPPLGYFPYYLLFLFFEEMVGFIIMKSPIKFNVWWYNIMSNGELFFLFYLYYSIIKSPVIKRILLVLGGIYVVYFLINYLLLTETWNDFQSFPLAFGYAVIIFAVFWYLIEFFRSDEVLKLFDYLIIWLSIGLLVYMIVSMPVLMTRHYLIADYNANDEGLMNLMVIIQHTTNYIMYSIYVTGILWTSKALK